MVDIINSDEFPSVEYIPLVESDIDEISDKAKSLLNNKDELELQKKQISDALKVVQGDLEELNRIMARKAIEKEVMCQWEINFVENNKKLFFIDKETGEKVYLRKADLTPEDHQLKLT